VRGAEASAEERRSAAETLLSSARAEAARIRDENERIFEAMRGRTANPAVLAREAASPPRPISPPPPAVEEDRRSRYARQSAQLPRIGSGGDVLSKIADLRKKPGDRPPDEEG
jgi:hypothetical protein